MFSIVPDTSKDSIMVIIIYSTDCFKHLLLSDWVPSFLGVAISARTLSLSPNLDFLVKSFRVRSNLSPYFVPSVLQRIHKDGCQMSFKLWLESQTREVSIGTLNSIGF